MRRVLLVCAALVMMVMVSPSAVQALEAEPSCQHTLNSYATLIHGTSTTPSRILQENMLMMKYLAGGCDGPAFVDAVMASLSPRIRPVITSFLGLDANATNHEIFCRRIQISLDHIMSSRDDQVIFGKDLMVPNHRLALQVGRCAVPVPQRR